MRPPLLFSVLSLIVACTNCGSTEPPPVEVAVAEVVVAPELMADLAVPTHPALALGELRPAPTDVRAFHPVHHVGDWAMHHLWSSRMDREWEPVDVQIAFDVAVGAEVERQQLKAVGEQMTVFAARKFASQGPNWSVVALMPSGKSVYQPLEPAEVLIGEQGAVFWSPFVRQPVTVEVVGVQSVTVPAGTFECLRIRRQWAIREQRTSEEAWWSRDAGLVASVLRVQVIDAPEARLTTLAEYGGVPDAQSLRQAWSDGRRAMGLSEPE